MTRATITALNVYPVKSCRGIALERATVTPTGLAGDRRWMVVNGTGCFLTQRELPQLALIEPRIDAERLSLRAPGRVDLSLPVEAGGARVEVSIWRDRCAAIDQGDEAAGWLSEFLGHPVRLVRFDSAHSRPSDSRWTGEVAAFNAFSDGFPVLVIAEASLADLNSRLAAPLPMNRFRPNLVLSGLEPYDEDRIHELSLGGLRLRLVKPCTRCKITTTDQATGSVAGDEPLRTLKQYRWNAPLQGVAFGQNAIVVSGAGASLQRGQSVEVIWK